jgi:hypothetical protein
MRAKRIGNIGLLRIENDKYKWEISCYYKNPYYNKKDECVLTPLGTYCWNGVGIDEKLFEEKELRYVIAHVTKDKEPDIISVINRPWKLNEEDEKSFKEIINYIYKDIE